MQLRYARFSTWPFAFDAVWGGLTYSFVILFSLICITCLDVNIPSIDITIFSLIGIWVGLRWRPFE